MFNMPSNFLMADELIWQLSAMYQSAKDMDDLDELAAEGLRAQAPLLGG